MPAGSPTDEELVRRCRAGDPTAFDRLVERYRGVTYSLALQRLGDRDAAADLVQQALLDAYSSLPSLREPGKFAPWLRAITAHLCADEWTRGARLQERGVDAVAAPATDPPREVERQEVQAAVRQAVSHLPRGTRLAVSLCYFDGLSCREVADFLGVSVSAIKSRLHEGRKTLRKGGTVTSSAAVQEVSPPPSFIGYSGDSGVAPLFWRRPQSKPLYAALYPQRRRDDEPFWHEWQQVPELEGLLRLWEYAGVVGEEEGELIGLVPMYTEADHEVFAAWHARVSQAMLRRLTENQDELEGLAMDFRGGSNDTANLRFITIVGRVVAQGVTAALTDGFVGSAHDWGGLGRAFIWGGIGRGLPCTGGYSTHARGDETHLVAFQEADRYPGMAAFREYEDTALLALLRLMIDEPLARAVLLAEAPEGRHGDLAAAVDHMLAAGWVRENAGVLTTALPFLPWSATEDTARLRPLADRICGPIADAAEELRVLAPQCSFARCRFTDTAYMLTSMAVGFVTRDLYRHGVVMPYADVVQPGRGAWLYLPPTHAEP